MYYLTFVLIKIALVNRNLEIRVAYDEINSEKKTKTEKSSCAYLLYVNRAKFGRTERDQAKNRPNFLFYTYFYL